MGARMITYDEIQLEVLARNDLTPSERHEVLAFIREFKSQLSAEVASRIPERLRRNMEVIVE